MLATTAIATVTTKALDAGLDPATLSVAPLPLVEDAHGTWHLAPRCPAASRITYRMVTVPFADLGNHATMLCPDCVGPGALLGTATVLPVGEPLSTVIQHAQQVVMARDMAQGSPAGVEALWRLSLSALDAATRFVAVGPPFDDLAAVTRQLRDALAVHLRHVYDDELVLWGQRRSCGAQLPDPPLFSPSMPTTLPPRDVEVLYSAWQAVRPSVFSAGASAPWVAAWDALATSTAPGPPWLVALTPAEDLVNESFWTLGTPRTDAHALLHSLFGTQVSFTVLAEQAVAVVAWLCAQSGWTYSAVPLGVANDEVATLAAQLYADGASVPTATTAAAKVTATRVTAPRVTATRVSDAPASA